MSAPPATGFLGALDVQDRLDFARLGQLRRYKAGATLLLEGDRTDHVAVVEEGRVKVFCSTLDGREVVLAVRGVGELLGELSAIAGGGEPRSATVAAMEDVRARLISANDFLEFVATHARVSLVLLQGLARRMRDADRRRIEYGAYDTAHRVACILVELAAVRSGSGDGEPSRVLGLSQEELAGMVGSSREAAARSLAGLRDRGLVQTSRRSITITDVVGLHRYATT